MKILFRNNPSIEAVKAFVERLTKLFPELGQPTEPVNTSLIEFDCKNELVENFFLRMGEQSNPDGHYSLRLQDENVGISYSMNESELSAIMHTVPLRLPAAITPQEFLQAIQAESQRNHGGRPGDSTQADGLSQLFAIFTGTWEAFGKSETYVRGYSPELSHEEALKAFYIDYLTPIKEEVIAFLENEKFQLPRRLEFYEAFEIPARSTPVDYAWALGKTEHIRQAALGIPTSVQDTENRLLPNTEPEILAALQKAKELSIQLAEAAKTASDLITARLQENPLS